MVTVRVTIQTRAFGDHATGARLPFDSHETVARNTP